MTDQFIKALVDAADGYETYYGPLPDDISLKMRDRREPGYKRKTEAELRLSLVFHRIFKRQAVKVRKYLTVSYPWRKAISPPVDLAFSDDDFAELVLELTKAIQGGILLFGNTAGIDIDYTLTNAEAAEKARQYVYDLVKNINATTVQALQKAIAAFVETPGMTIADVMRLLPFGEDRVMLIAVTEITRAYADGNQMAGEALAAEFPDVRVIKHWFTNNDDRVCPICSPLNDMEVDIDEDFDTDITNPPAHPNCRCWIETQTEI